MDSDTPKDEVKLPPERRMVTQLNSFRPFSERDLETLGLTKQVPSSIPSLKSGLSSPVANTGAEVGRIEATASATHSTDTSPIVSAD